MNIRSIWIIIWLWAVSTPSTPASQPPSRGQAEPASRPPAVLRSCCGWFAHMHLCPVYVLSSHLPPPRTRLAHTDSTCRACFWQTQHVTYDALCCWFAETVDLHWRSRNCEANDRIWRALYYKKLRRTLYSFEIEDFHWKILVEPRLCKMCATLQSLYLICSLICLLSCYFSS